MTHNNTENIIDLTPRMEELLKADELEQVDRFIARHLVYVMELVRTANTPEQRSEADVLFHRNIDRFNKLIDGLKLQSVKDYAEKERSRLYRLLSEFRDRVSDKNAA